MMMPIKHAARFLNGAAFKPSDWGNTGLPILRIAQLTGKPFDNFFNGTINRGLLIRDGDLLFSWSATIDAFIWSRGDAILNQHIFKVVPKKNALKQYLFYVIKAHSPRWADDDAHGSTMKHIKKDSLTNKVWIPNLETQKSITEFLDREVSKINSLLEKKERLSFVTIQKMKDFVDLAVTGNDDPRRSMQSSELAWVDQIPDNWITKKAKYLFKEMNRAVLPDDEVITAFRDGKVCLRSRRRSEGYTFAELEVGYQRICKGDLVIHTMDAFAGAIGVSEDNGKSTGEYAVCTPLNSEVNVHYYAHLLRCMARREYIFVLCPSVRERAPRFRFVRFAPVILPIPPRGEQDVIVTRIENTLAGLRAVQSKTVESIERLKEFRHALITAAVTSQIDVTTWGKQGHTNRRLDEIQEAIGA
jgi:type I restriction enzyme S subunit